MTSSLVSLKEFKALYRYIVIRKLLSFAPIECIIDLNNIVWCNLDLTKGQGTFGKYVRYFEVSLYRSSFPYTVFYYDNTWAKNITHYNEFRCIEVPL